MAERRTKGRAAPPLTELPRPATLQEHRQTDNVLAFAVAAVHVLEERFGFTREQSRAWFDAAVARAAADKDKPLWPLW